MTKKLIYLLILAMLILLWIPISTTQEDEYLFQPFSSPVWDAAHGIIAVVGCSGIQFYDETLEPIQQIEVSGMRWLAISPNRRWLAAASTEQTVFIDLESLQIIFTIEDGDSDMTWHPSESWLALFDYDSGSLRVIDVDSQEVIHEQAIDHLALNLNWRDDGYINYVGVAHGTLYRWLPGDVQEYVQELPIAIQYGMFQANVSSPDGSKFAFMLRPSPPNLILEEGSRRWQRGPLGIWNLTDGTYTVPKIDKPYFSFSMGISWHPSSKFFALSTNYAVTILNATSLEKVASYPIPEIEPTYEIQLDECRGLTPADVQQYITWNPDGTQILVTSWCRLAIFSVEVLQDELDSIEGGG